MDLTRRDLLKAGVSAAALAAIPRPLVAHFTRQPVSPIADPDMKELALRAVDAARGAGATYADVRLTHTRQRSFQTVHIYRTGFKDSEQMVVGVRALVGGYWGFASGPVWTKDEMDRLGQEAVHLAKINMLGQARAVDLAPAPVVRDGRWVMPVEIDPFEVAPAEIFDFLLSLAVFMEPFPRFSLFSQSCQFQVQDRAFASTDGGFCSQRLYQSSGDSQVHLLVNGATAYTDSLDTLTPAGIGWELYRAQPLREQLRQLMDEMDKEFRLPTELVKVGRYDAVCDAMTVAQLVNGTLGPATELDRVLGYEANGAGTSYINDPGMMGSYQAAAPLVTLVANRNERGGVATVQWDDEGVAPDEAALVKDGVLVDFQTTRESAAWLADRYAAKSVPVRSRGCATAPTALQAPMQHAPNMRLLPGNDVVDFENQIATMFKGIAIKRTTAIDMDSRAMNGYLLGRVFRVDAGKRVARIEDPAVLFKSPELWKGLTALGGAASLRRFGLAASKGEPPQTTVHSVTAPPAVFSQLALITAGSK